VQTRRDGIDCGDRAAWRRLKAWAPCQRWGNSLRLAVVALDGRQGIGAARGSLDGLGAPASSCYDFGRIDLRQAAGSPGDHRREVPKKRCSIGFFAASASEMSGSGLAIEAGWSRGTLLRQSLDPCLSLLNHSAGVAPSPPPAGQLTAGLEEAAARLVRENIGGGDHQPALNRRRGRALTANRRGCSGGGRAAGSRCSAAGSAWSLACWWGRGAGAGGRRSWSRWPGEALGGRERHG